MDGHIALALGEHVQIIVMPPLPPARKLVRFQMRVLGAVLLHILASPQASAFSRFNDPVSLGPIMSLR